MRNKLNTMLELQDSMNKLVHPEWQTQGFAWHRAIWLEAAEAMEFSDYKWWKKTEDNIPQIKMELVDIWHFLMSAAIEQGFNVPLPDPTKMKQLPLKEMIEEIARQALNENTLDLIEVFYDSIYAIGMNFDELYRMYIGKNVLNRFRQDNGYKTGTYQKVWGGMEDNAHLEHLLSTLNNSAPDFADNLYKSLEAVYKYNLTGEIA